MLIVEKKAAYVATNMDKYPRVVIEAIMDWAGIIGCPFTSKEISNPDRLYEKLKHLVEVYAVSYPWHPDICADFKRKRKKMREMYDMPKGKKIPFDLLVTMERLNGKPF